MLRARLSELPDVHARLRQLAALYRNELDCTHHISLPPLQPSGETPWHQFVLRCEHREQLRSQLEQRGLGTAIHYEPIPPAVKAFGQAESFPSARALGARSLSLPFDSWLSDDQASRVCEAVRGSSERSA